MLVVVTDLRHARLDGSGALTGAGRLRADIANALVRFYKEHYGRGPTMARTIIDDRFIFVVLENGFTRSEQTLIHAGDRELVSTARSEFTAVMDGPMRRMIEELTGRRTLGHTSQVGFEPPRLFEIFELDEPLS